MMNSNPDENNHSQQHDNTEELGIHHATIQVESSSHPQNTSHSDALICDISGQLPEDNNHIGHNR